MIYIELYTNYNTYLDMHQVVFCVNMYLYRFWKMINQDYPLKWYKTSPFSFFARSMSSRLIISDSLSRQISS